MQRRDFMKMLSGLGLGLACPLNARAAGRKFRPIHSGGDVFFMDIMAYGGMDSSLFTDPKLGYARQPSSPYVQGTDEAKTTRINPCYMETATAGNICYPVIESSSAWSDFFDAHYNKLTVLNGVDASSTSHLFGTKAAGGGMMTRKYPALAALHAATQTLQKGEVAIPFLSAGTSYDVDRGIVAKTTLSYGEYGKLENLADPNHAGAHHDDVYALIKQEAQARLERMLGNPNLLPRSRRNAENLKKGRDNYTVLGNIHSLYTSREAEVPVTGSNGGKNFQRTIRMALCAYKAGACYGASLRHTGFDNHGDYAINHRDRVSELLEGLSFLFAEAEALDILDRVSFQLFSEFSRYPWMNDGDGTEETGGKSHWRATSNALIYHPDLVGNKVVGLTDTDGWSSANFNAAGELGFSDDDISDAVLATGLEIDESYNQPLARFGIHQELRDVLQIDANLREKFPLDAWNHKLLTKKFGAENASDSPI